MPPLRGGLGRGLSALIPEAKPSASDAQPAGLLEVAPGQIRPNPRQPRRRFEETALQELAASIVEHGLLQPLIVTPLPASEAGIPEFQLI
ncbi:MAG TPA: ParB N-terminal domain-containing protein, partial [Chloroflexota bacterium]